LIRNKDRIGYILYPNKSIKAVGGKLALMWLAFTKMQGGGNDFIVIDAQSLPLSLTPDQIRFLANRRFGVGCDQVLLVEAPRRAGVDFYYRIYNADGGEVGQCGNGARCFARFVRDKGLTCKDEITVETRTGLLHAILEQEGQVRVNMGTPQFEPEEIPLTETVRALSYTLTAEGEIYQFGAVSLGNPHAVLRVDDVSAAQVERIGPAIQHHPCFPEQANVGFMEIINREQIRLRVYERGVGETLACGSGACAAVAVGRIQGLLAPRVQVILPGGALMVSWNGQGQPLWMSGPAVTIFEGRIEL
jgi:diaminopimelate epimerase